MFYADIYTLILLLLLPVITSILMPMDILKLLIFFLIFLSSSSANSDLCPISYCPNNTLPIKYPFKLQNYNQTPNCSYTNLSCTTQGAVILNLPNSGDFYVRDIHYGHGFPLILLYDPQNCLPKRIMGSNFSSFIPGMAAYFAHYTFYGCPYDLIAWKKIPTIDCLSNSTSAAVAIREDLRQTKRELYSCEEIATLSMPVSGRDPPDFIGDESDFVLGWTSSSCESCPYKRTEMVSRDVLTMAFIMISFAAIIMPAVICIGCCISFITMYRKELKIKRSNAATSITAPS